MNSDAKNLSLSKSASDVDTVFPTAAVTAALLVSGGGLIACGLGLGWGASPSFAPWWTHIWLYLNVASGFLWFVVWPAVVMRPSSHATIKSLGISALGVLIASAPGFVFAWYFGVPVWSQVWQCLFVQVCWGIFALGVVGSGGRWRGGGAIRGAILSFIYLMGPLIWYIGLEFTQVPSGLGRLIPAVDLLSVIRGSEWAMLSAAGYGICGALLIALALHREHRGVHDNFRGAA